MPVSIYKIYCCRYDFFSGLGWMMTKPVWQELSVK